MRRSLATGTVAIMGFLVLFTTTDLFYFGPPTSAQNAGEVFASVGGAVLAFLTWALVGWGVAWTTRALRFRRLSVLIGMIVPVAAITTFALTVDLDAWSTGFGALAFAAASSGVLLTSRRRKAAGPAVMPERKGHPPVRMAA